MIAIGNRLLAGDQMGDLFGNGGLISLIMYLALLGGLVSLAQGAGFPLLATVLVTLTLGAIVVYLWRTAQGSFAERFFTTLIEAFEAKPITRGEGILTP